MTAPASASERTPLWWTLIGVNSGMAVVSAVFGVLSFIRPSAVTGRARDEQARGYFPQMFGARAIAVAAVVVGASVTARPSASRALALVYAAAGAVQAADVAISAANRTRGVVGASIATAVHLGTAAFLRRS